MVAEDRRLWRFRLQPAEIMLAAVERTLFHGLRPS